MNIPIITFILGNPSYLKFTLSQGAMFCDNIVLIGDSSNENTCSLIKHINCRDLSSKKSELLKKIYTHRSTNSIDFDVNCLLRWFYMEEYMVKHKIDKAVHMDPDVLIYDNIASTLCKLYSSEEIAYSIMERDSEFDWNCMGSVSYWTLNGLQSFTNFILDYYKNRQTELDNLADSFFKIKRYGGISDMTFLSLFQRLHRETVKNVALVHENKFTFDSYIGTSQNSILNEYESSNLLGILTKKVVLKNKKPICLNLKMNKNISFKALHFQGQTKNLIAYYYIGDLGFMIRAKHFVKTLVFFVFKKHIKNLLTLKT
ncbi:hypothetical protein Q4Q34_07100 [Flavivirga abyssicola]|uniref:hypothetical protein n=1 Tax=Flavivirga abyssicola TaxID=3063533 RepID=UPI0026DF177F|nr:hypothetical protein [Flavivirga sp. MEBiC07777]WVK14795.1 hypothetical protein Q4Q34_07100 [Flavivirga sp. MEBiC07777]